MIHIDQRRPLKAPLLEVAIDVDDDVNRSSRAVVDIDASRPVARQREDRVVGAGLPRVEVDAAYRGAMGIAGSCDA